MIGDEFKVNGEIPNIIGILHSSIIRLKKDSLFSSVDFSSVEDKESISIRIFGCPHWYNWTEKTITSILGFKTKINEKIEKRISSDETISLHVQFPLIEKEGKSIKIEMSTYMFMNKPVYKYLYTTDNLTFGQKNLDFYNFKKVITAILTNKPISRKNQIGGFMQRLNMLSPNFGKNIED